MVFLWGPKKISNAQEAKPFLQILISEHLYVLNLFHRNSLYFLIFLENRTYCRCMLCNIYCFHQPILEQMIAGATKHGEI